ncbi:IclR family transcriptional regulator domain-containing protein [Arsenicicoccus sp. oral taxon 190]|uniref:IclR family transcriptional regulator domain-containing protein n=1 Tax=Arsenicicoccus sp. oral taxon 190 TaxID=1658671 RepID=UPI00067A0582|nr:IclR family transcriptional regulator C-terminal domain-containing protein [Arsenicicoccus sp. oral taxon 190]AKT50199.1 IclR family transcriptional regulator [Arsenicicoccus sp. oral taxon 190]
MSVPTTAPGDGYVQSLARGLAVIRAFDADHPRMTLSEVARRTDLSRAAARRFLLTLESLGYVRSDDRAFQLTPQVLQLGFSYLSSQTLPDVAQPHLQALSEQIHESTSVAVLDGDEIVYVARHATSRIMTVSIRVGTRFPAYATSMGRVLLAGLSPDALQAYLARVRLERLTPHTVGSVAALRDSLDEVRESGWCVLDQELELGLRSLAVPVHDGGGRVVAAANVSTKVVSTDRSRLGDYLPPLRATVHAIEDDLRAQSR